MSDNSSNETQTDRVADAYYVRKSGYYYRPNAQGYTVVEAEAGRFTLDEAISYSHPNGPDGPRDGIRYEPAPAQTDRLAKVLDCDRQRAGAIAVRVMIDELTTEDLQQAFARHRIAATQSLSTDLANAQQRVEQLEGENALLKAAIASIRAQASAREPVPTPSASKGAHESVALGLSGRLGSIERFARAALTTGKESA